MVLSPGLKLAVRTRTSCFSPLGIPWMTSLRSDWGFIAPCSSAIATRLMSKNANPRQKLLHLFICNFLNHTMIACRPLYCKPCLRTRSVHHCISLRLIREPSRRPALSSASPVRLKVMLLEIVSDLLAEHGALRVGSAEVDAGPYSGVDYVLEYV